MIFIAIGIAGFLGAVCRYAFTLFVTLSFPFDTMLINFLGCFAIGWFIGFIQNHPKLPTWLNTGISTGFIGSFTTFSTLSMEVVQLLQMKLFFLAFMYIFVSMFGGLLFVWLGFQFIQQANKKN